MSKSITEWLSELNRNFQSQDKDFTQLFTKKCLEEGEGARFVDQLLPLDISFKEVKTECLNSKWYCYLEAQMSMNDGSREPQTIYFVFNNEGGDFLVDDIFKDMYDIEPHLNHAA